MLNFDNLPKTKPAGTGNGSSALLEKGVYRAVIKSAEMKPGSNGEYLMIRLEVTNPAGGTVSVLDKFFPSDKPLPQYKLAQFMRSINCILQGSFELKDLTKIIVNKTMDVALKIEKSEGWPDKNVADVFDDMIYYPIAGSVAASRSEAAIANDDDCPFTVGDEEY